MTKSCLGLILGLVFTIEVAAAQKLVFAVQPSYAKNFLQGNLEHNQVIKLARYLDIPIEVYECPWVRCVKAIETGEADIIDDLFYAEDRNTFTYYLKPHFDVQEAGFRFFADNSQTPSITSWEQLRTLRVGSLRGYKHFPLFDNDHEISKVEANTFKPLVGMILKGRLDALIVAPSFDIQSLQPFDINGKLTKQPFAHLESIPLFLGVSRKSHWYHKRDYLERGLKATLIGPEDWFHAESGQIIKK